jgi:hypothetical protein
LQGHLQGVALAHERLILLEIVSGQLGLVLIILQTRVHGQEFLMKFWMQSGHVFLKIDPGISMQWAIFAASA